MYLRRMRIVGARNKGGDYLDPVTLIPILALLFLSFAYFNWRNLAYSCSS